MKKAEDLFAAWEAPMVQACLQGHMGRVHTRGEDSALASIGDFCFLAGEPSPELLELADAPILTPEWRRLFLESWRSMICLQRMRMFLRFLGLCKGMNR